MKPRFLLKSDRPPHNSRGFTYLVLTVATLLSVYFCEYAIAEAQPEKVKKTSAGIVELYCQNNGKLAQCAGQMASDCSNIVKPIVDRCLSSVSPGEGAALADEFERCFWRDFTSKYGKDYDYSPECFHSTNKDAKPLQPVPPELQGLMKPLHPATNE
jgi:hypothetical protein